MLKTGRPALETVDSSVSGRHPNISGLTVGPWGYAHKIRREGRTSRRAQITNIMRAVIGTCCGLGQLILRTHFMVNGKGRRGHELRWYIERSRAEVGDLTGELGRRQGIEAVG